MGQAEKTIGIIGAGAFGTSLAKAATGKGHKVTLWSYDEQTRDDINTLRENKTFLPGIELPEGIFATSDIVEAASGKDALVFAVPSLFLMNTLKQILDVEDIREGRTAIATVTKGFLPAEEMPRFIIETMENYLPGFYKGNVVYISGPSHAEEVGSGKITGLISASQNPRNSILFRELLGSQRVKIYASLDVVGVQTCAAVKNVIAIAFGILDALKDKTDLVGDNTESLLFAAGLNEIQTLGRALGSTHPETFTSIAGVGDLDVTCRSQYGRNRRFGREIILKDVLEPFGSLDDLIGRIQDLGYIPEGAIAAKYSVALADKLRLKLPIIQSVFAILNKESRPEDVLKSLMNL